MLNEAFLERFPVTFEQEYPSVKTEQRILENVARDLNVVAPDFCKRLVDWGDIIRKTFYDGGIEDIISTRRLVHIIRAYSIFADKAKAISVCINRFDDETKQAFMELYDKVDADFNMPEDEHPGDNIYVIDNSKQNDIMTNAWSLLYDVMTEHSEHYYDFDRNDPNRENPFEKTISMNQRPQ